MSGRWDVTARRVPAAALAAALLAACAGGSDSESSDSLSTAVSSESTATTSTRVPVDSTGSILATTTTVPESPTTESAPLTTVEPTTTVASPADAEAQVRATLDQSFADFSDCLTSMPSCDPSILQVTRAGELLEVNVARIEEWNAAGYTVIDRDQYRYVIESVEIGDEGTTAIAIVCLADGSKLVQPGAGPGGADVIVDGVYVSGREAWEMRLDPDGQWRAYSAPVLGVTEESDVCPAA